MPERKGERSPYAIEGEEAHKYSEKVLGGLIRVKEGELMPFEVGPYLEACERDRTDGYACGMEVRVNLDKWFPGEEMFGTADWMAYNEPIRHLKVRDLKYGKGVPVSAKDNDQLMYYGLGAFAARPGAVTLSLEISQPRIKSTSYQRRLSPSRICSTGWIPGLSLPLSAPRPVLTSRCPEAGADFAGRAGLVLRLPARPWR